MEVLRLAVAGGPMRKIKPETNQVQDECQVSTNLDIQELEFGAAN